MEEAITDKIIIDTLRPTENQILEEQNEADEEEQLMQNEAVPEPVEEEEKEVSPPRQLSYKQPVP